MTWYLSGPMSGLPAFNYPAFEAAAAKLRSRGLEVCSAHEINHGCEPGAQPWEDYLRRDLIEMLSCCEGIILLPGWSSSKGARLEFHVAAALNMKVRYFDGAELRETA